MNKITIILLVLSLSLLFVGCGTQPTQEQEEYTENQIIEQALIAYNAGTGEVIDDSPNVPQDTSVDYDLVSMSSTMVYSVVYDMVFNSSVYVGKSFKLTGLFETIYDSVTETDLYFIIVNDATGCCPQGIEIKFPEDIPPPETTNEILTVKGIMGLEDVGENTYFHIMVNEIVEE